MKNNKILTSFLLLLTLAAIGLPQSKGPSKPKESLLLTIYLHGWATATVSRAYVAGRPINIRCVWKNSGRRTGVFLLKDHDAYHGTLSYPMFLAVRITDSSGRVLTKFKNELRDEESEWWHNPFRKPDVFNHSSEMPGDTINLKSGQEVTRIVPLNEMLKGLDQLGELKTEIKDGLKPGTYFVEISYLDGLSGLRLVSNKLEIKVVLADGRAV